MAALLDIHAVRVFREVALIRRLRKAFPEIEVIVRSHWAIAHRLCRLIWKVLHDGVRYVEYGEAPTPLMLKRRRQRLVTQLRHLGYEVTLTPTVAGAAM